MKRLSLAVLLAGITAGSAMAQDFGAVALSGSAEMDLFYRTNNTADGDGKLLEEIAIVINLDGKEKLDSGNTLKWRLAQKVATDYRFDSFGQREAWIGYAGGWGELRFGNQFSNAYLTNDWPYGAKGATNLTGDFGAHSVQYTRAISYFSPNLNGFNLQAQYDLGTGDGDLYAYEVTGSYAAGPLALDLGYTNGHGFNNGTEALAPGWDGGWGKGGKYSASNQDSGQSTYYIGARYNHESGFGLAALYKHHEWDKGTFGGWGNAGSTSVSYNNASADQWLIRGSMSVGQHSFALGYQAITDMDVDSGKLNSGISQIHFQYDYPLSKATGFFVQARHEMMDKQAGIVAPGGYQIDGWNGKSDNVTRVLVGTWTGF
ncbi:porin [Chitinibacter sp. SCUT-21]|uniref:porin n=1 Tax=Chitinibacter sp. SCUT-21 TaxID=2970891 RepID=UPI0035A57604